MIRASLLLGVLPVALPLMVAACNSTEENPVACTTEARAAINVDVRDSLTGQPAAAGAIGVAAEGSYADTLDAFSATSLGGAYERAGTYAVTVRKPGYREWRRDGVVVTSDPCHIRPVQLQARLVPE